MTPNECPARASGPSGGGGGEGGAREGHDATGLPIGACLLSQGAHGAFLCCVAERVLYHAGLTPPVEDRRPGADPPPSSSRPLRLPVGSPEVRTRECKRVRKEGERVGPRGWRRALRRGGDVQGQGGRCGLDTIPAVSAVDHRRPRTPPAARQGCPSGVCLDLSLADTRIRDGLAGLVASRICGAGHAAALRTVSSRTRSLLDSQPRRRRSR
jgi:hypothetical protein